MKSLLKRLTLLMVFILLSFTAAHSVEATANPINTTSTTLSTSPSTMRHIVRTSDGTLHSFVQMGTQTATCNGSSSSGLGWFYSTDGGTTWVCGGQVSSDTTNLMYASATVDSSDNVYLVYSAAASGGATAYDVFYRKLTKGGGSTWTLEAAQTIADSVAASTAYTYATIEIQGTTRLWTAIRHFDGTNYQVRVLYSDGLSTTPTWTLSAATLDTAGNSGSYHIPAMVRFGSNIGVLYNDQTTTFVRWRFRADGDGLTSWVGDSLVGSGLAISGSTFAAISDSRGNVYVAVNNGTTVVFSYWNGAVWTANATVSSSAASSAFVSLATDGMNVWVFYGDTTNLNASLSGNRKLVYKKGTFPFTASEFDVNATAAQTYQGTLDKYWSFFSSAYTNDTTDAGNTTTADTQMVRIVGDIAYFGKTEKFDALSWVLSTNGVGGVVAWEYWNGSTWATLTLTNSSNPNLLGTGWVSFTDPANWATTTVNSEGTPYYYVRARVTTIFSTAPVATQIVSVPLISWASVTPRVVSNTIYGLWTENAASPAKVREAGFTISATTENSASAGNTIGSVGYSSTILATQPSTMRHIVKTSEGTLHAFVQAGTVLPCGSDGANNSLGLNWIYSTDGGTTWVCGGQVSSDTTNLMYASATVDASDNVYVTYSVAANGGATAYDLFYRKLTKGSGSTWTLENAQTVLDSTAVTTAYSYATIEVQGSTRLWIAVRYYDGTNYQVRMLYSDALSSSPTWTQSSANLETPGVSSAYHIPTMVRFASKIGVIYSDQTNAIMRWRFRSDSDSLTSWAPESTVGATSTAPSGTATFSAVGDAQGNIYFANNNGTTTLSFMYWNGLVWSTPAAVSASTIASSFVSVSTDGGSAWVFYSDTTNLTGTLSGNRKLVYKKGIYPFTATEFDTNATPVAAYQNIADKYWSYVSSAYTNDTTDAGNTTVADTAIVTGVGDIMYFGKTAKFDSLSWVLSTAGVGGQVVWEYWNGSAWVSITRFVSTSAPSFSATGYITFIPNSDWATTTVNAEGTPYYYVRARTLVAFSPAPVATQIVAIPQINWASTVGTFTSNSIDAIWTEGAANPTRVRRSAVSVSGSVNTAAASNVSPVVGYSSTTLATQPSTMHDIVRTSDGTIHTFVQAGTVLPCGSETGNNSLGLNWIYSTDAGVTWQCGGQVSTSISTPYYASATVDANDNIYLTYSAVANGASSAYQVYYRKLTKGVGSTWTLGTQQLVLDPLSTTGYTYANVEVEGTTRVWLSVRYFDGTNYQVQVYYTSDTSAAPSWNLSTDSLDTGAGNASYHIPMLVRFGSKIGVVYSDQTTTVIRWRFRTDGDALNTWGAESTVGASGVAVSGTGTFSAIGDSSGNVYFVNNNNTATLSFMYWNGSVWTAPATVSTTTVASTFVSLATDGGSVWVIYGDTTNLNASLSGNRKLVYKKGIYPFTATEFDTNPTPLLDYQATADKYWSYVSSSYTNDTTDAGNTTAADTSMVTGVGDILYFGKTAKFDSLSWVLSTAGVGGQVAWEYYNGSAWVAITDFISVSAPSLTASGYISFIPGSDWATVAVNGEGTPYYYVRARTLVAFSPAPVATQIVSIPQINWASTTDITSSGNIYAVWTENGAGPTRVKNTTFTVTEAVNATASAQITPNVGYSSTTLATQPSTMRHIVKTSDGTMHAFVQAGTILPCGQGTSSNTLGLNWIYSTDSGTTWQCGGQISANTSTLFYASATTDSADNIYLVYSAAANGGSAVFDTFYRKLTKGVGASWTIETEQTALNSTVGTTAYSYAVLEAESTNRLWLAVRYFDGTNYQVQAYYSDSLAAAPTWTQSSSALDTPGATATNHFPTIVRYGSSIGVIYNAQSPANQRWRFRADSDGLSTWSTETTVSASALSSPTFSSVGDTSGNVYVAMNVGTTVVFTYWNGSTWSTTASVSASAASALFVSVATYNGNVWVFYGDTTNLNASLSGNRKLVYKKGVAPFAAANFDSNATPVIASQGIADKYWSYVSSSYTNDTTDAGNTTAADTSMVTGVGDILYFGKTAKFDSLSWVLSTAGVGGQVAWEYYNGSAWVAITDFISVSAPSLTASGYISFIPGSDWATVAVNGEGTPYYYVRARVTRAFSPSPVGTQIAALSQINWANVAGNSNILLALWTENASAPIAVRFSSIEIPNSPNTPSALGPAGVVGGAATSVNTPTLSFTLSDNNSADTVQYRLQVDDSADFSSPVVDYTSALATQGAKSFIVGQAAGSGSYTVGSSGQTLSEGSYYWRVMATDSTALTSSYAVANSGAVAFIVDSTVPASNATSLLMTQSNGGLNVSSGGWTKGLYPAFSWTAAADNVGGSGLKGYCLYLGTSSGGNPASNLGLLGTSPASTSGTTCQFIVATNSIDFANASYRGASWLTSSSSPYYLNIKAVDNAGNIVASSAQFEFYYDGTAPTNVSFISPASGNFSNVIDMSFSWPTTGGNASVDTGSGVLGWQYQLNSTAGAWQGTTHSADLSLDYIPATASAYDFIAARDADYVVTGANTIYFRTVDNAGNVSSDGTIRSGSVIYAGQAPTFGGLDTVTVTPSTATTNSFALSWPAATPGSGHTVAAYYYMINTPPPSTFATLSNNSATYINNGALRTLSARSLPNVNKGTNTVYVVAVDNAETTNYSPSNYITGSFTLNSSDPDNVEDLVVSDSSLKSEERWNVALTWKAPTYQGAGNVTYLIYRSEDNVTFTQVGSTTGLSYVDTTPESAPYYYQVVTQDGANAVSSGTNPLVITPTGQWVIAPTILDDPEVTDITTRKAVISWSTSRTADSKVQYGTSSNNYFTEEPSNSTQVTSHEISLSNLSAGQTYYYRVKWTDEDGNTGVSDEFSFETSAAPSISAVKITGLSISSAYVTFTVSNANSATINYGPTISYGLTQSVSTSTSESTYTVGLTELTEGTLYHLQISAEDSDDNLFSGDDYTFETLPIPKVTNVRVQQVAGMPTATLRLIWQSNAPISTVVTYYPLSNPGAARDYINLTLKKTHEVILSDLQDETDYALIFKGKDTAGNSASESIQNVKTLLDLRPPEVLNLSVESTIIGLGNEAKAQVIVSWDTDEPATTQVEYAQGTGSTYGQSSQEDTNKTTNHVVSITGLTPSKIYHLRALSKDKSGNLGQSADTVVITPKYTQDALTLVIDNLSKTFGFLKQK